MSGTFETRALTPFGLEVRVPALTAWEALDAAQVESWVAEHRVVVLRGLSPFAKAELPAAARRLGPLQAWRFGSVNELRPAASTKNYLYTDREVPLHWDGAFAGRAPRYLFFHCVSAPQQAGGETVFVDTTRVWAGADERTRDRWRSIRFQYRTEHVVHYGGRFTSPVVARHPDSGETVMRFAEPVDDLNPVSVRAEDVDPLASAALISELREALREPSAVLAHTWCAGDVVVADNHALLHGRRAFPGATGRHIRRVNVHGRERTWRDALRDALRIRRPEFMVAELPILLIPALLVAGSLAAVGAARLAEIALLFFLLFHVGDMVNCLADRDLDAVYKTHLSEAIYGLGVANVQRQIALTAAGAVGLAAHLAIDTGRWELLGLVIAGLGLGAAYSIAPVRLKGRGPWQVVALWAVIFVGPMLLVARALGHPLTPSLLLLIAAYGAMQEGIILINTAEDLPEDREAGIRTTAVALGLTACTSLAAMLVAGGGAAVIGVLLVVAAERGASPWAVAPLSAAWLWVTWEVVATRRRIGRRPEEEALPSLRASAARMPLWITATAWTTLLSTWLALGR